MTWPLAEAKNRFSELFEKALRDGPQRVSRRGKDEVVVVSAATYERLRRERQGFVDFLMSGPALDDLTLGRDRSPAREIEL
jgi:antitoxin Phd